MESIALLVLFSLIFCLAVMGKDIVALIVALYHESRVREIRVEHVHRVEGWELTLSPSAAVTGTILTAWWFEEI